MKFLKWISLVLEDWISKRPNILLDLDQVSCGIFACTPAKNPDFSILRKRACPKNTDFWVFPKKDLSKKSGLSPKVTTHGNPNFKQATVFYFIKQTIWKIVILKK